ncbi:MAG TPA: ABC transporter permease [Anaerolineales bacterium]|nr:ABC transporter permease [Anaerolineales bacterium]
MPIWLQKLSALIPVTYALRAMRLALLQGAGFDQLWGDILALCLFCVILLPLSLITFTYAVRRARVNGSLAHY